MFFGKKHFKMFTFSIFVSLCSYKHMQARMEKKKKRSGIKTLFKMILTQITIASILASSGHVI